MLARWAGQPAQLWELTRSHQTLSVAVGDEPGAGRNLVIYLIEPVRIVAPIRWGGSQMQLTTASLPTGEQGFLLKDEGAGMKVLCSAVELKENVVFK